MIEKYPILVIAPIIGASVNIFTHLTVSRLKKGRSQMLCLISSFVIGLIIMSSFALFAYSAQNSILNFLAYLLLDIIAYMAFSYGYFHFININIASLRIRILHEIDNAPEGLLREEILNRYSAKQIIENRLKRLMDSNQLIEKNGYYFLGKNRTFLILFWLFEVLKYIILGKGNRFLKVTNQESIPAGSLIRLFWQNQFFRFLLVGAINTIFGYSAYAFLVILRIDYRMALTISTILCVLFNFYTNGRFVFRNKDKQILLKFIFLNLIMYILNQGFLISFVNLGIGKLASQAIIVPIVVILSFVINKNWVFREKTVLNQNIPRGSASG